MEESTKKQKLSLIKRFSALETIEEKSFWITAPVIALLGVISLTTAWSYTSPWPSIILAFLCLIIPGFLMVFVSKKKNYHSAYPILCISIGAISIPLTFVFNGGFLSGMPIFCVVGSTITALCYDRKWRLLSLGLCILGNTGAFLYVYYNGTPFPLDGTKPLYECSEAVLKVYNDIFFSYYTCSLGLFFVVSIVTKDIRKYKLNQDALQSFFDSEKRKEIIRMALSNDPSAKTQHRNAAILFADISNFTPITEKMPSDLISSFLNEFFSIAGNHIHKTGGIIDKYIGDCIMAYWIDQSDTNCVLSAIKSMIDLKHEIYAKAEEIYSKYGTELNFSVGIAYGDVIFGDIGSDTMHDYTVIGDAVNTASRIQNYAVGGEILISDYSAEKVKDLLIMEKVENDHFFKGKNRSIDLYRVLGVATNQEKISFNSKEVDGYELTICGCRGSFPVSGIMFSEYGGETSCYVIKKDDYAVIVDCGTGLKNAMKIVKDCTHIDILLTHFHYDHILGFLMSKFPLNAKVRIFGHFSMWRTGKDSFEDFMQHPYWPVEIVDTERIDIEVNKKIELLNDMSATFYISDHPDEACVITLMCKNKKITFLADCEDAGKLSPEIGDNSEIVFFDGMFDENDEVSHKGWGHGTWQDGVRYIYGKNIKKMIITHHNPENGDHSLMLKEMAAREMSQNVSFAKSGDTYYL